MTLNNYIVNGKPLGFSSNTLGEIIPEVLRSYLPIKPTECMLTGKPILTKPKITLLDGNTENVLFSNILVTSAECNTNESFQHELLVKFKKEVVEYSVKFWVFDNYPSLRDNNLKLLKKYFVGCPSFDSFQIFLDLISLGVKGIVFTTVTSTNGDLEETESCHYQDILRYRMLNPTNIVSLGN